MAKINKFPNDANQLAKMIVDIATDESRIKLPKQPKKNSSKNTKPKKA